MNRTRRDFLAGSAAAAAASLTPAGAAGAPPASAARGPHLGCVTYVILADFDLEQIIQVLEATGFEGVELRTTNKHGVEPSLGADARAQVRKRFERSKIKLVSFGTVNEFHSPDAAERKRHVETAKQFIDLAHDTGAIGIKVRPNGYVDGVPHETTVGHISSCLRELGDYGAGKGIQIWMEVHGPGTAYPKDTAAIMRATNHKNVGLTWNCNQQDLVNGSVKAGLELLRPWVRTIHLRDITPHYAYPWKEFFGLLNASRFEGWELAEIGRNPETARILHLYKALWTEYNRSCS